MTRRQRENLRLRFLPEPLLVLFVGEAPPASGKFFYNANSGLYHAMKDAFAACAEIPAAGTFLDYFQNCGCYLIDLCHHPVDRLPESVRRAARRRSEASVVREIRWLQPTMIVVLLRSIERNIARAVTSAEWSGSVINLPYPGRWKQHRTAFTSRFAVEVAPSVLLAKSTRHP